MKCTGSSFISWDCLGSTNISSSIEACSIRTWTWHRDDINVDEVFLFFPAYCPLASLYTSELPCHFRVDRKLVFESRNIFDFDSDEACRSVWNSADVIEGASVFGCLRIVCGHIFIYLFQHLIPVMLFRHIMRKYVWWREEWNDGAPTGGMFWKSLPISWITGSLTVRVCMHLFGGDSR